MVPRALAKWLTDQGGFGGVDLGASFFFKREEGDCGTALRFFPTILRQLIVNVPELGPLALDAIQKDPQLLDKALGEQFNKLIDGLLKKLKFELNNYPVIILVVDALDECEEV